MIPERVRNRRRRSARSQPAGNGMTNVPCNEGADKEVLRTAFVFAFSVSCRKQCCNWKGVVRMSVLIDPHSRFLLRHILQFRAHYGHGEPLPFRSNDDSLDVESVLKNVIAQDRATITLRNQDIIRITDFHVDERNQIATILFRRSDPDASKAVYEHRPTRRIWKPNTTPDDAVAISAHLFINLESITEINPSYSAILEEIPGIGRTYIKAILANLMREVKYNGIIPLTQGRSDPILRV